MTVALIPGHDDDVARWMFAVANQRPMAFDMAVGLANGETCALIGGIMFTNYNGHDAEVHFYGPGLLKPKIVRAIFYIAVKTFDLSRLTVHTRKEHMARGVRKLGAIHEGVMRRLYGPTDAPEHAAQRFAFFRERMEELAGIRSRADVRWKHECRTARSLGDGSGAIRVQ